MTGENEISAQGMSRRPLLKMAAGGAALTTIGVAARLTLYSENGVAPMQDGVLALSTHSGSDVQSLHLELDNEFLPQTGDRRWESRRLPTSTHSMVAFTWRDELPPPVIHVRARRAGSWTPWTLVPPLLDLPDEPEQRGVRGTDLLWVGRAEDVQMRFEGRRPPALTLVLLYPEPRPADALVGSVRDGRASQQRSAETDPRVPRPNLVTRKEWGANESLRDGDPLYNHTIKQVHVHHTVNANNYTRQDVPALIRGMYAYHTQTLGWSDIGYNFLVDRFGRAFVGRAGGPPKLVRGAHTLGFNHASTGISAIGNYETARPTDAMLDAIANVAAWKLDPFDRDPRGTIRVQSEGSDKYPSGREVRLPVIDGHRDTNDTACPGRHLYDALPKIRRRAKRAIDAAHVRSIVIEQPAVIVGAASLGETLRIEPGTYTPDDANVAYEWVRDAQRIPAATAASYELTPEDVGATVGCVVTLSRPEAESIVQRPSSAGPVTARPELGVVARSRRGRALVRVSVVLPAGVGVPPTGQVTVAVGNRTKTLDVIEGGVEARFGRQRRMGPGKYQVQVNYRGTAVFLPTTWVGSLRVE